MVPTPTILKEDIFVPEELFDLLRKVEFVRDLLKDVPDSEVLALFGKANLKPGGSKSKVRQFVEAKLPEFLKCMRRHEPMRELLATWHYSHWPAQPEGVDRKDLWPLTVRTTEGLDGWRALLFSLLTAGADLPDALRQSIVAAIRERVASVPDDVAKDWDGWARATALSRRSAGLRELVESPELHEDLDAGLQKLTGVGGPPESVAERLEWIARVEKLSRDVCVGSHVTLRRLAQLSVEILDVIDEMPGLSDQAQRLAPLRAKLSGGDDGDDVSMLAGAVSALVDELPAIEKRAHEIAASFSTDPLVGVIDDAISFVRSLGAGLSEFPLASLRSAADKIERVGKEDGSRRAEIADHPALSALVVLLDPGADDTAMTKAWSDLEYELGRRFCEELRPHLDARRASAAGETEGPNGREFEAAGSGAPEAGDGPEAGAEGPARTSTGSSDGVPAEALSAGEPASVAPPQSSPGSETGGGEDGADASSDPATARVDAHGGGGEAPRDASTTSAPVEEAAPDNWGRGDSVSAVGSSGDASGERPSAVQARRAEAATSSVRLQDDLQPFTDFRDSHWVDPDGICQKAPWLEKELFVDRLMEASRPALERHAFEHLYVFSRALEELKVEPFVNARDVQSLADVWTNPSSSIAGVDPERAPGLRDGPRARGPEAALLGVFLECVRPHPEEPLSWSDAQAILASVEVSHADLRAVLGCLLPLASQGLNPVSEMRKALQATLAEASREDLLASLADARKRFQEVVKTRWSAAGGRIERTHCRKAWGGFVSGFVQPLANVFYLSSTGGDADHDGWDLEDLKGRVRRLLAEHDEVARKAGARFTDRSRMDSAAREIADAATAVVEAATQLRADGAPLGQYRVQVEADKVRRLQDGDPLESLSEECCRQILIRLIGASGEAASAEPALSIGLDLVVQHPDLLRVLIRTDGVEALCKGESVPLSVIDNWAEAAALLMADPAEPAGEELDRAEALRLLATRLRAADRGDLLTCLLGAGVFDMQQKRQIHVEQSDEIESLYSKVNEIEQIHARLDEMAVAHAPSVRAAAQEAEQLLGSDEQSGHEELPLLSAWVDAIRSSSVALDADALETVRVQAEALREPERREAALGALARSRPGEALAILDPTVESRSSDGRISERRTEWRNDAEQIYSATAATLREADVDAKEFVDLWTKRPRDHNELQRLERLFWYFISGEQKAGASGRRRQGVPKKLRELRPKDVLIDPVELRAFLKREGLNPTFLPQLRDFQSIVISSPRGATAASLARDVARAVSSHGENCLVAMLIPGLSANQRAEILGELRRRKLPGAVVDDVDICRLVHPGGERPDGFLGFLEIVLEQLRLSLVTPFRGHDGQHIKEETFVGRPDSVAELVGSERYTRVFSGRKLGKSALLKFVELTHDKSVLPSGNTLRVLDIIVAGGESESWLTAEIKSQMERRLGFKTSYTGSGDPGDELTACMAQFARERPDTSLLVILDEADVFVEGQLKEYDTKREKCLSFRMMKTIPGNDRDRNDLPRVRFVFSGYRVTNTNEGTWANAGGVLKLPPLSDEPARQLIEGPFARIGVDIREHAAYIARRCGFQPAVIIRFGERLLERLVQTRGNAGREGLRVKREDIVETFSDSSVEDEIRTVVTNNFQGNRVASIIFHSLLLAFKELPPGAGLADAPVRILEQLTSVDSDTSWLREIDPTEVGEIQRALTDLEDRQLLVRGGDGREVRYRLKFPHHLAVLLQTDPANVIRQQVQALRAGREDTHLPNLLSQQMVEELREIYRGDSLREDLAVAVVGSLWIDSIQSEKGGVADKLGLRMDQCLDFRASPSCDTKSYDGRLVGLNARPSDAEEILSRRGDGGRPPILLGGPELLRWAIERDEASSDRFYETFGLRRLSARRLGWWFERLRNYQFASADAVVQIHRHTGGIPFLVALFDEQLSRGPGEDVSEQRFREAEEAYRGALPDRVVQLRPGRASGSLSERELQILAMISDLGCGLGPGEIPTPTHELGSDFGALPADFTALRFLDLAGFIVLRDGKVVITDDQPLQKLLEVLRA